MKTFNVTPGLSRDFEVLYNGSVVGRAVSQSIFSAKTDILIGTTVYELRPANFWHTRYELTTNGRVVLQVEHLWGGRVHFSIPNKTQFFDLRPRSLFYRGFVLKDNKDVEVVLVSAWFKWKNMAVTYEVLAKDIFANTNEELLLLFMAVYYFRRRRRKARNSN